LLKYIIATIVFVTHIVRITIHNTIMCALTWYATSCKCFT